MNRRSFLTSLAAAVCGSLAASQARIGDHEAKPFHESVQDDGDELEAIEQELDDLWEMVAEFDTEDCDGETT